MRFEDYLKEGSISQIPEIEKEKYILFLQKSYEEDKLIIDHISQKSSKWTIIVAYYAMHDITKYYLAKNHNLKISGRGVHLATLVALKHIISNKELREKVITLIQEAQHIYETLNSPLKEKILPTLLSKARSEREKSQYYTGKKESGLEDSTIFVEQIMHPYLKIVESLMKNAN